jgi:quinohemoprotein ethanol dehydrogenase
VISDLRRSGAILSQDTFNANVLDGALEPRGMISFSKWLNRDDTAAVRAYIAGQAKALRAQENGGTAGGKTR